MHAVVRNIQSEGLALIMCSLFIWELFIRTWTWFLIKKVLSESLMNRLDWPNLEFYPSILFLKTGLHPTFLIFFSSLPTFELLTWWKSDMPPTDSQVKLYLLDSKHQPSLTDLVEVSQGRLVFASAFSCLRFKL